MYVQVVTNCWKDDEPRASSPLGCFVKIIPANSIMLKNRNVKMFCWIYLGSLYMLILGPLLLHWLLHLYFIFSHLEGTVVSEFALFFQFCLPALLTLHLLLCNDVVVIRLEISTVLSTKFNEKQIVEAIEINKCSMGGVTLEEQQRRNAQRK